jgi:hypothetical protein
MARFNRVQINDLHLTKDSSAMAIPCLLSVSGLDKLKTPTKGRIVRGLDNTPTRISADFGGRGVDIAVTVETLYKAVFDALNAEIDTACDNFSTLDLVITGDTGDFNLTVIPGDEPIVFPGDFINGRIKKVTYNFVTT